MLNFRRFKIVFLSLLTAASITTPASAQVQQLTEAEAIRAAYDRTISAEELFSPSFLAQVSVNQINAVAEKFLEEYGPIETLTGDAGEYELLTATHRMEVSIRLGTTGLIEGLLFKPAEPLTATLDETLAALVQEADLVSYVASINEKVVHEKTADTPLAVGSAFKLGVLKVLIDDIDQRKIGWSDVYELTPEDKSKPSGYLQDYPDRAPLTIHTLAAAMIAESDNTATDMLMRVLGADRVAQALGIDIALTTKQLFALKNDEALRMKYATSDRKARINMLADIQAKPLPKQLKLGHHNQGFEWYVPDAKLCQLLQDIGPLDVFDINDGPLNFDDWDSVRFKGGSEDGVLNLSAITIKNGKRYCMSVTLNHSAVINHEKVIGLFNRAMRQLAAPN